MTNIQADFPIPFAGDELDHGEHLREPEQMLALMQKTSARAILIHKGKIGIGAGGRPHRIHPSDLVGHDLMAPGPLFLGMEGDRPIFAFSVDKPEAFMPEQNFVSLRGIGGNLKPSDLALAGRAKSLFAWHFTDKHCVSCGSKTVARGGGIKQQCTGCGAESFPRVNPVAIMLVTDGDRVLLGRGAGWPEGAMSALAGFISPGESIEEAAQREVLEEAGIKTKNPRYVFSQPWPFPAQLMMGIMLEAVNTDITIDPKELEDARWFTREDVLAVYEKRGEAFMRLPRQTIAHQLLRHWLAETA
jgi:NAD+ diphosphatase